MKKIHTVSPYLMFFSLQCEIVDSESGQAVDSMAQSSPQEIFLINVCHICQSLLGLPDY